MYMYYNANKNHLKQQFNLIQETINFGKLKQQNKH